MKTEQWTTVGGYFSGEAKVINGRRGTETVGVWTDGVMASTEYDPTFGKEGNPFRLSAGKKYKITIEEIE